MEPQSDGWSAACHPVTVMKMPCGVVAPTFLSTSPTFCQLAHPPLAVVFVLPSGCPCLVSLVMSGLHDQHLHAQHAQHAQNARYAERQQ